MVVVCLGRIVFTLLFFVFGFLDAQRDPFHLNQISKQSKHSSTLPRLLGIISHNDSYGAIMATEDKQCVVFKGDICVGYTIKDIDAHSIIMVQGDSIKKITLDEAVS